MHTGPSLCHEGIFKNGHNRPEGGATVVVEFLFELSILLQKSPAGILSFSRISCWNTVGII